MPTPKHAQPLGATPSAGQLSLAKALFDAIRDGNSRAVINLAPLIDDLDSHQDSFRLDHPLTAAARYDLPSDAVEALLGRSNPLLADKDGFTALMLACWGDESHSVDVVRRLLPASNPMAVTAYGDSALHFAISVGNPESVALLLPVSDLAQPDSDGLIPLEQARQNDQYWRHGEAMLSLILAESIRRERLAISEASAEASLPQAPRPRL